MILLDRLKEELKQNRQYIQQEISQIGRPINIFDDKEEKNPSDIMMKNIFSRLKESRKELKILDKGINKILSASNTKAMLRLTIIMTILTVFGIGLTIYNKICP